MSRRPSCVNEFTNPAIENCLREPIHLSGGIQPHGYLVSVTPADWIVRHVSANIGALFGMAPEEILGQSLRDFIADDVLQGIGAMVTLSEPGSPAQRAGTANIGGILHVCDISVHQADGLVHVELEPQAFRAQERAPTSIAQSMIHSVAATEEVADFFQLTAEQVRQLVGFDRVMVYQFRHDDSGEVIAESHSEGMEPYLGLRYPASDIPPQARELYLRNRVRIIPDANYAAVPILPNQGPTGIPLDLSQHVLRSVSPVHLEYLRNMGVAASMSISIVSGGKLWGLIACHHRTPKMVPAATRTAADLFGMFVSMRVSARDQEHTMARIERAQQVRDALSHRLSVARNFDAALADELELLRRALDSDGALLVLAGRWHSNGRVPTSADRRPLLRWLEQSEGPLISMTENADDWNASAMQAEGLAGVLAINLGASDDWLFLFRVEEVEQVRWAGEPHKALVITDDGQRIAPRKSFAVWRETVRGRSTRWSESDRRGAERLHHVVSEQRRRSVAHARDLQDLDSLNQRQTLMDQKRRLDHIATLLDGLMHLDDTETGKIGARISRLENDLRRLMHRSQSDELQPGTHVAVRV